MVTYLKPVLGILAGGLAGFLWYRIVGCKSGTCPITSNPYASILYGMVMAAIIAFGK